MRWLIALMLIPILASANIGKITVLKGNVTIKRAGDIIKAKTGTELKKHDFIKTEKNGKVQIVFKDKTIFTIGKSSTLDIADFLYDESKPKKNKAKFNVLKGAFSSITGRIGKLNKSKFKLKTKSASIGIRGTIVKANQKTVMCTQGAITVTTPSGATVRVEAGQKTDVSSGVPTAPAAITKSDEKDMDVDVQAVVVEDIPAVSEVKQDTKQSVKATESAVQESIDDVAAKIAEQMAEDQAQETVNDNAKDNVANTAVETKDLQFTGKTISKDGTRENIAIDAKNLSSGLNLEEQGLVITDDAGNAVDSTSEEIITWGHWKDDPSKKWVAGKLTDVKVLDDMRNNTEKTINAQYNGQVMGTINGTDNILMDSNNKVEMNLELGAGKNNMDGSIDFNTKSGQQWNSTFNGSTEGNTFSSSSVGGNVIKGDDAKAIDNGNVKGSFYGSNAQAVGGTFELNAGDDKATGVFKATK